MTTDGIGDEVFGWLSDGRSPPAYLTLLGPGPGERMASVLANLRVVAGRLRERPGRWSALIRAANWRHTLVGCSAVLLTRETALRDDLIHRLRNGSWVAPQLAVALGLVHPADAVVELEDCLRATEAQADPKRAFAAVAVLKQLGRTAGGFEASELFRAGVCDSPGVSAVAYDKLVADRVVQSHWAFWTGPAVTSDATGQSSA